MRWVRRVCAWLAWVYDRDPDLIAAQEELKVLEARADARRVTDTR